MAAKAEPRVPGRRKLALTGLVAGALALLSASTAAGNILRSSAPQAALGLYPLNGLALERAANRLVGEDTILEGASLPENDRQRIVELSRDALAREPTAARGLRNLALAEDEPERAAVLMQLALRLSPRDPAAHLWFIRNRALAGDPTGALAHFDALLRLEPAMREALMPQFVQLLAYREMVEPVGATLAKEPEWEELFWQDAAQFAPALPNLVRLRMVQGPATDATQRRNDEFLLQALANADSFDEAERLATRVFAGFERRAILRNGDFAQAPATRPFDWRLFAEGGLGAWLDHRSGQLVLTADPGSGGLAATQLVKLVPGSRYAIRAQLAAPAPDRARVDIALRCLERPGSLPRTILSLPGTGTPAEFDLAGNCRWYAFDLRIASQPGHTTRELALDALELTRIRIAGS